jgi:hypothetical protein
MIREQTLMISTDILIIKRIDDRKLLIYIIISKEDSKMQFFEFMNHLNASIFVIENDIDIRLPLISRSILF